jgi:CheY-like chemotaxis protein
MSSHTSNHPCRAILLVEDNPADVELAAIAIRQSRPEVAIHVVHTGDEALAFLHRQGDHEEAPVPDLVLLDLNLPGRAGTEVLDIIKSDATLRSIPVIMFSNSDAAADVEAAYRSGANAYLLKPMEYADIKEAMANLLDFWYGWACLPRAAQVS